MSRPDPPRLSPELLVAAYSRGIFPMANSESGGIDWFSPDPRAVIPLEDFHVPRSLARRVRQRRFALRTDTCFEEVMRCCSETRPGRESTWIDERLVHVYTELHRRACAHSVEAWLEGVLVGGLYGVSLGGAFFGESMFSRPELGGRDASKVCMVALVELLRERGFRLLDTQFWTPHLDQFGCREIPRTRYLRELAAALAVAPDWPSPGKLPRDDCR